MAESAPPRVLFVMTSRTYRAGAFLEAARKLGVEAVVGSEIRHVLSDLNPEMHLHLDFQDLEGATDQIVRFAEAYPLQTIVSPDDDGLALAAMASDALGLSHNALQAVAAARNKYRMRQIFVEHDLPSPWFERIDVIADPQPVSSEVPYPCVLKPLALSGSRGVIRANNPAEFIAAFEAISQILQEPETVLQTGPMGKSILVEGYIPGEEVALEGLMDRGMLTTLALFDKPDPLVGPYFEETIYITPSRLSAGLQEAVRGTASRGAAALGIREGPLHAELRINDTGVYIVEIAPRSIGGYCSRVLRFQGHQSLEELILRQALGRGDASIHLDRPAAGVMMVPTPRAGTLLGISGVAEAQVVPSIDEVTITIPVGGKLRSLPYGNEYLGFIFSSAATPEAVETALRTAHARLQFRIEVESSRISH